MKKLEKGLPGRSYDHYGLNQPKPLRLPWHLLVVVGAFMLGVVGVYHHAAMQAYEVTIKGKCAFEVKPTGWNGGDELPCGSIVTHFSVPLEIFRAP